MDTRSFFAMLFLSGSRLPEGDIAHPMAGAKTDNQAQMLFSLIPDINFSCVSEADVIR